jgi:hypothetical protein
MITLHPTGYPPVVIDADTVYRFEERLGKRLITVELFMSTPFTLLMAYNSDWEDEHPNVIVLQADTIDELCTLARMEADLLMPPGAGYPGTPEYKDRQAKLKGQIEHAALIALTECLALRHRAPKP